MQKIGFIGTGNMGYAMMKGIIKNLNGIQLTYTDANKEKLKEVHQELGQNLADNNIACIQESKYIILAIKPQYFKEVFEEIRGALTPEHVMISLSPGVTIERIKEDLGQTIKVVRSMPNTPALVGAGTSAVSFSKDTYIQEERDTVKAIFNAFGVMVELPEHLMDAVVPVSGSSPAYVYMFIEAMADAAVRMGLPRDMAYQLAAGTVLGSAKMVLETGIHPGALKDAVCSPGGTTIEAVAELEKNGFRSAVMEAMKSCYDKTKTI
ncbi:pyrroline-5-carboxylate reductase [Vallitalea pronyensis]|uniref:Pyrroline-5-carboxylate reductase n=1 Tax=Vallitalea pronyensis TaxID=1348613 RepID=A0A8J8SGR7_9FIRM|nr:pyrroline-5-carboxylate reductase [Vallitalea pronyensis]QUI23050.1 pyrroline-5-carboxylate reductase [Vallitalea pronyensis]